MSNFEKEIYELLRSDYNVAGATQSCKIDFKKEVCKNILKYLKNENDIEITSHESGKPGTTSWASGSLVLEKYNIKITIEVNTDYISVTAKYLGNEEKIKGKEKYLFRFSGKLAKSIMLNNRFESFQKFVIVKTVEFIYELDNECEYKLLREKYIQ